MERNRVSFDGVRFVVLDEADRMLDMGFMSSVEKMMDHPTMVPTVSYNLFIVLSKLPYIWHVKQIWLLLYDTVENQNF